MLVEQPRAEDRVNHVTSIGVKGSESRDASLSLSVLSHLTLLLENSNITDSLL
jgi:hypothetical protein